MPSWLPVTGSRYWPWATPFALIGLAWETVWRRRSDWPLVHSHKCLSSLRHRPLPLSPSPHTHTPSTTPHPPNSHCWPTSTFSPATFRQQEECQTTCLLELVFFCTLAEIWQSCKRDVIPEGYRQGALFPPVTSARLSTEFGEGFYEDG